MYSIIDFVDICAARAQTHYFKVSLHADARSETRHTAHGSCIRSCILTAMSCFWAQFVWCSGVNELQLSACRNLKELNAMLFAELRNTTATMMPESSPSSMTMCGWITSSLLTTMWLRPGTPSIVVCLDVQLNWASNIEDCPIPLSIM